MCNKCIVFKRIHGMFVWPIKLEIGKVITTKWSRIDICTKSRMLWTYIKHDQKTYRCLDRSSSGCHYGTYRLNCKRVLQRCLYRQEQEFVQLPLCDCPYKYADYYFSVCTFPGHRMFEIRSTYKSFEICKICFHQQRDINSCEQDGLFKLGFIKIQGIIMDLRVYECACLQLSILKA